MTDKYEEQVAGVTLHFKRSSLGKPQADERLHVVLTLDCSVKDEELWRVVETKFREGFRVFTGADFHIEVLDVTRQELRALESCRLDLEKQLRQARDRIAQLEEEVEQYKRPLSMLGQALRGPTR